MSTQNYLIPIIGFAILNGMFSPILLPQASAAIVILAPGLLISSPNIVAFLAYLLGSTLTLMISGIPAALYERLAGTGEPTPASMWIWLAATAVLTLPAVPIFLGAGGM